MLVGGIQPESTSRRKTVLWAELCKTWICKELVNDKGNEGEDVSGYDC